jgi:ribonuclease-3
MKAPLRHLEKGVAYHFKDAAIAEQALTHRSANRLNNERLEFLGDAVLGFLIAEELSLRFPLAPEGELSRMRAGLVNQQSLADIATRLGIGELLILGPGELKSGGRQRASILADALEAVLGAIYCDGGLDACRACVIRLFEGLFLTQISSELHKDAKTQLQETLQARALPVPRYEVVSVEGTDHDQTFVVSCHVSLLRQATIGRGRNRRLAEQDAAGQALQAIES